jgi:uncharacterized membrane protein
MREWLAAVTEPVVVVIDAMALAVVVAGTIQAFVAGLRTLFARPVTNRERREVWLVYGRVLVAALTFQLAADIVESSVAADWGTVGRLAAVAVIRTFLNYFLERDLTDMRERQHESAAALPGGAGGG